VNASGVPSFDAEKWDALQELVNLGMGSAGASLAAALGSFVELKVPRLELVAPGRLGEAFEAGFWNDRDFSAVRQVFFGGLMGETLMLFQGLDCAQIAQLLGHGNALGARGQEQVTLDLAAAVMGACLGGIAEPLGEVLSVSPPALVGPRANVEKLLADDVTAWNQILLVDVDLHLEDRRLESRVLMFLSEPTLVRVDRAVTRFLETLAPA
jgi:chemotaxis protein CheY-P-specific phosphatase CheC